MTDLHRLFTSHGSIMVEEAGHDDPSVLLIHGNSFSREVFRKQLGGTLSRTYRLVALICLGTGDSSDALNVSRTYTVLVWRMRRSKSSISSDLGKSWWLG